MTIKNEIAFKRFIGWINILDPKRLWQPNHLQMPTSRREFSDEVKEQLEKLL